MGFSLLSAAIVRFLNSSLKAGKVSLRKQAFDLTQRLARINEENRMLEVVEELNYGLRVICNDLRPPSLSNLGLLTKVETLCEETMQNENRILKVIASILLASTLMITGEVVPAKAAVTTNQS